MYVKISYALAYLLALLAVASLTSGSGFWFVVAGALAGLFAYCGYAEQQKRR